MSNDYQIKWLMKPERRNFLRKSLLGPSVLVVCVAPNRSSPWAARVCQNNRFRRSSPLHVCTTACVLYEWTVLTFVNYYIKIKLSRNLGAATSGVIGRQPLKFGVRVRHQKCHIEPRTFRDCVTWPRARSRKHAFRARPKGALYHNATS